MNKYTKNLQTSVLSRFIRVLHILYINRQKNPGLPQTGISHSLIWVITINAVTSLRIALHVAVAALLVEALRLQQVAHGAGAGMVIVGLQAEVLRSLADGLDGYLHLLVGVGHGVPRVLHVDDQQLAAVAQAVFVVAHGQAGTLHVVAALPPAAQGDADGGKPHPERLAAVGCRA